MSKIESKQISASHALSYKVAIADLDGTLLDANQRIPDSTLEIIREFKSKGGLFTIATGRNEVSVKPFVRRLSIDIPCIVLNGAKVVYGRKVVFEEKLPQEQAYEIIRCLRETNSNILLHIGKKTYIEDNNILIDKHLKKDGTVGVKVGDLTSILDEEPNKILIITEDRREWDVLTQLIRKYDNPPNIVQSESTYLEILPPGVSKGAALKKLVSYLDIPISKVMAFGDNLNDLEMLDAAGLGVAMRNANPILKEKADFITGSNEEEGVAQVLKLILNKAKIYKVENHFTDSFHI